MSYQERLNRVIPGGAHTYSRGQDQFPANAPQILERGKGAYVWDLEGNRFLDYGMALRAVTLGYAHEDVNSAALREIDRGNNLTRASRVELEAAELLVDLIPSVDMVKFAKNGSNATTAAAKIARAYTGRRYICVPRQQPFFSFDDWFIGTTSMNHGVPESHAQNTLVFDYNDLASLERLFEQFPKDIAAVMLEPATTLVPYQSIRASELTFQIPASESSVISENFLNKVHKICERNGSLFILDEMITGFRWHLQGAQTYFNVKPDITTFGKGMSNGFSVAAVAGRREVMEVGSIDKLGMERTFILSSTHGGEMCGLGAFKECVKIYKEQDVCRHLWEYGARLRDGLTSIAHELQISNYFMIDGPAICLNYITLDDAGIPSAKFRTLFSQEMIRNGVLMPWIAVSTAHGDEEFNITIEAARKSLMVYKKALHNGISKYLFGPEVKPVFRKYN